MMGKAGNWIFLAGVAGLYALTGFFSPELALEAFSSLKSLTLRVLPILLVVFALLFLVNLFLERSWVIRHLGKAAGVGGWAFTVVCGVLSVGPLYVWYPLLGELKEKGASNALISTFLYSRALKLPLLPLMAHYFGFSYTVALSVCIVTFSVLSGLVMGRLTEPATHRVNHHSKKGADRK